MLIYHNSSLFLHVSPHSICHDSGVNPAWSEWSTRGKDRAGPAPDSAPWPLVELAIVWLVGGKSSINVPSLSHSNPKLLSHYDSWWFKYLEDHPTDQNWLVTGVSSPTYFNRISQSLGDLRSPGLLAVGWSSKYWLVGGFNPSEKYDFVGWDDEIPNIWKNRNVPNHQPVDLCWVIEDTVLSRSRSW